jgi:DNA polymerase III subunit epsilon
MKKFDPADRDDAILWARNVLKHKTNYLIMDTETSGLTEDDEIIQMAIIDLEKNVLYNTLLKPKLKKSISKDSTSIHGIKKNDLIDAPCFDTAVHKFIEVTKDKTLIIYNAEFDTRLLKQTCYANRCQKFPLSYWCAMKEYSKFVGEWNEYHQDYKYQKLRGGNHSALGDCLATLQTIEMMAESDLLILEEKNEIAKTEDSFVKRPIVNLENESKDTGFRNNIIFFGIVILVLVIIIIVMIYKK